MRRFMRAVAATAVAVSVTVSAGASPAAAAPTSPFALCTDFHYQGTCMQGYGHPGRISDLGYTNPLLNDRISSIKTAEPIDAWTDPNFRGYYGYFAPNYTWPTLSWPYNDSISSLSKPGW